MIESPSYQAGEAAGGLIFTIVSFLLFLAAVVGVVWLISWAIRRNRKPKDVPSLATAYPAATGYPQPGTVSPGPAAQVDFGLHIGELPGPLWSAFHATGAPMTVTVTSANVLALAYATPGAPATRISKQGAVLTFGSVHPQQPGWPEALVEVNIQSPAYAPFTVFVAESGAHQLWSWANA